MPGERPRQYTYDLFGESVETRSELQELQWPDARRFPLNLDTQTSYDVIWRDLLDTQSPSAVPLTTSRHTGYRIESGTGFDPVSSM